MDLSALSNSALRTTFCLRPIPLNGLTRARRAEARGEGAQAPLTSRPAAVPPAHALAHAASEWMRVPGLVLLARFRGSGYQSSLQGKTTPSELGLLGVGAEGCKIKGGISREAQRPGVSGIFEVLDLLKSFRGISEAFQVRVWASIFRYPIARKGEFFEDFA
jgi:hypothetical protein